LKHRILWRIEKRLETHVCPLIIGICREKVLICTRQENPLLMRTHLNRIFNILGRYVLQGLEQIRRLSTGVFILNETPSKNNFLIEFGFKYAAEVRHQPVV